MDALLMLAILSVFDVDAVLSNTAEDNLLHRLVDANEHKLSNIPAEHHVGEVLEVEVKLFLKQIIKVDEQNEMLYSQFWLQYMWKDDRFKWNASEFEGLDVIYIPLTKMWTPDIYLYNNAQRQVMGDKSPQSEYVRVLNNGTCQWWPMYEQSISHCHINVTWFPFDDQRCRLIYESYKYNGSQLNITAALMPMTEYEYHESEQWQMLGIQLEDSQSRYGCCMNYSRSTFTIHLRRKYMYYVFNLIMPYFLFSIIAVCTFLLPPSRTERLTLGMTTLLTLNVYHLGIGNMLPNKSGAIPIVGAYFQYVLTMCFVSLAVTIFIVYLHSRGHAVPPSSISPRVRRLICDRLASLLSIITTTPTNQIDGRSRKSQSENYRYGKSDRDRHTAENSVPSNRTLTSILDLLETRISVDDEDREKSDNDLKQRRDWMLAAAVIDRLCFIALLVAFTVGTLAFLILVALS